MNYERREKKKKDSHNAPTVETNDEAVNTFGAEDKKQKKEGRKRPGKKKSNKKQDHQLRRIYKSLRKQQTPTRCIGRRQEKEPGHFSSA